MPACGNGALYGGEVSREGFGWRGTSGCPGQPFATSQPHCGQAVRPSARFCKGAEGTSLFHGRKQPAVDELGSRRSRGRALHSPPPTACQFLSANKLKPPARTL
jgi:hypothetical protein